MNEVTDETYVSLPDCWTVLEPEGTYDVSIARVTQLKYSIEEYDPFHIKVTSKWYEKGYSTLEFKPNQRSFILNKHLQNCLEDWIYKTLGFYKTFSDAKNHAVIHLEYNLILLSRDIQKIIKQSPDDWN